MGRQTAHFLRHGWKLALFASFLLPSGFVVYTLIDAPHLGIFGDDAIYCVSAKALAEGAGYQIPSLPASPPQTKYPILYPLLLSCLWRLKAFPGNLSLMMAASWLLWPLFGALVFLHFRRLQLGWLLWVGLGLVCGNLSLLVYGTTFLSEMLFCCLLLSALWLLSDEGAGKVCSKAWVAGLLAGAALLTRTAAVPLLLTAPAYFLRRRQARGAILFLGGMAPSVIGWGLWVVNNTAPAKDITGAFYSDYLQVYRYGVRLSDVPAILWGNCRELYRAVGMLVFPLGIVPFSNLLGLWILARAVIRARQLHVYCFVTAYCAMLIPWHYSPTPRLLLPVLPFFVALLLSDVRWLLGYVRSLDQGRLAAAVVAGACTLALCIGSVLLNVRTVLTYCRDVRRKALDDRKALEWIDRNTPKAAKVMSTHDGLVYLYTGRQAISHHYPTGAGYSHGVRAIQPYIDGIPKFVSSHGIEYVFLSAQGHWFHPADAADHADQVVAENFRLIYRSGDACVYAAGRVARSSPVVRFPDARWSAQSVRGSEDDCRSRGTRAKGVLRSLSGKSWLVTEVPVRSPAVSAAGGIPR